jgi:predicted RNA-binding protein with PUA-like domain
MAQTQKWVFLADPTDYGYPELAARKSDVWDGVKNARAQSNMRKCRKGDHVLIYHTAPDKAIAGIAKITGEARPDPKNADRVVVDVAAVKPLDRPVPLAELKADAVLATMSFVRMPRVAVWPVTEEQWARVLDVSGTRLRG